MFFRGIAGQQDTIRVMRATVLAALLLAAAPPIRAPGQTVLRGPYLQLGTPTSIVVRWRTDVPADSRVDYGTTPAFGATVADPAQVTDHVVVLSGLSPDTRYGYA